MSDAFSKPPISPAAATKKGGRVNYGPLSAVAVTVGSYISAYVLFFMLAGIGFSLWILVKGGTVEDWATRFEDSAAGQFVTSLVAYSIMAGLVYLFLRLRKVSLKQVGLPRLPSVTDGMWAIGTFGVYFVSLAIIMALVTQFVPGVNVEQEQQLGFDKSMTGPILILVFLALAVLPPIVEEFIMRGFLFTGLRRSLPIWPTAIIVSFIFSIAHLQLGAGAPPLYVAAIDTFVLSMFLVYLRVKTGTIWAGIFVHAIKNTLAFAALFIFKVTS